MRLGDGATVESVLMTDKGRAALCVSSQVGCTLACAFCATGRMGFQRDLSAGEIVGEVLVAERAAHLSNLVFMGMGEPLLNLDNVLKAIRILSEADGLALSPKRITVSTSGILEGIERLRESGAGVNLALSLNSPFDEERRRLMPVARRCSVEELAAACEMYAAETGREVSLEYVLFSGVNTTARHAAAVARLAAQIPAKVNLIAFNTVKGSGFKPPEREEVHRFRDMLVAHRARVTIRYRRGRDIAAGCGQLRAQADVTAETQRTQRTE
jgi:23S rRNA (adenine2503-C2)-methyltransferase